MEKIVKKLIDNALEGVDVYFNNGSIWLIFTETKQWVFELEKNGMLWYNYHFFKNLFSYLSMNVVENQDYITKYVEDMLKNGVNKTIHQDEISTTSVEYVLQNGVEDTSWAANNDCEGVEYVLQNGVKDTQLYMSTQALHVKDTIKNGVKKTLSVEEGTFTSIGFDFHVEDTIKNGEIKTNPGFFMFSGTVENAIKNGVKDTKGINGVHGMNVAIQNGVKQTGYLSTHLNTSIEDTLKNGVKKTDYLHNQWDTDVDDALKNGIKQLIELPDQSGELKGYGEYYKRQKDRAKPHVLYVKDAVEKGVKIC